jgi:hypothetical protein
MFIDARLMPATMSLRAAARLPGRAARKKPKRAKGAAPSAPPAVPCLGFPSILPSSPPVA